MRLVIFPLHLFKVMRLPRKSEARSYEVLHLSHKIIFPKLKIWCSKMQPLFRKSAPGPPNISDEHVSCTAPATENYLCRSSSNVPRTPSFLEMLQNLHFLLTFDKVLNPTTSERPKVLRTPQFSTLLTWKCASRHNGINLFYIATSISGPRMACFVRFDLEMCFAPQRRALFRQIIVKTQCFATFLPFSRTCIFFLLTLSLLWSSLFFSSRL